MKIKIWQLSFLFFLLQVGPTIAQVQVAKYTYSLGAEYFRGFIMQHHTEMGHLIKGHPEGVRLNFVRKSYGAKAWEQRYNYPEFIASLSYYDLKNDEVLGNIVSLNTGLGFHLNDFTRQRGDFQVYMGIGLAYFNKVYDEENNNKNNVVSSHLPWNINLRASYWYLVGERIYVGTALQLSHFSNASRSVPNFGLNIMNLNVGARYQISSSRQEYLSDRKNLTNFNRKSFLNIDLRAGVSQMKPAGTGPSLYLATAVFWNKRISQKSILDAGVEGFMNQAYEKQIDQNHLLVEGSPDYRAVSVMFGHELLIEKLALVTQIGIYVYKPYQPHDWLYSKIGLKYYFNDNLFATFTLKSHFAVAEVLEYGIGYRF